MRLDHDQTPLCFYQNARRLYMMEEPPQKRVKADSGLSNSLPPLPPGWTEHTAPTGHKYYYNKATKKSTYTRPAPVQEVVQPVQQPAPAQSYYSQPYANEASYTQPAPSYNGYQQDWNSQAYGAASGYPPGPYGQQSQHMAAQQYLTQGQNGAAAASQGQPQPLAGQQPDGRSRQNGSHRPRFEPRDRPKRKEVIPNCGPWVLVYTKLERRFVHNTKTRESYWKFPSDVMKAVIAFDQLKLEEKHDKAPVQVNGGASTATAPSSAPAPASATATQDPEINEEALAAHQSATAAALKAQQAEDAALLAADEEERVWVPPAQTDKGYDSSEYEEIYVTDDSDAESAASSADEEADAPPDGPLEFNEDDIAFQLAAMQEEYGLEAEEEEEYYSNGADPSRSPSPDLAQQTALFTSLLDDSGISPFTPWDSLLDPSSPLLADERFTALPSARARKAAHAEWVKTQAALRVAAPKTTLDPRVVFLELLSQHAKIGVYWAEFKRKWKKDAALKGGARFGDREMEKAYREFVAGLKKSVPEREGALRKVLGEKGDVRTKVEYWLVPLEKREGIAGV